MSDGRPSIPHTVREFFSEDGPGSEISVEAGLLLASQLVRSPKLRQGFAWSSLAYTAGRKGWDMYKKMNKREGVTFTVDIDEDDDAYDVVMTWMRLALPVHEQKAVQVERRYSPPSRGISLVDILGIEDDDYVPKEASRPTSNRSLPSAESIIDTEEFDNLRISFNNDNPVTLHFGPHTVEAQVIIPQQTTQVGADGQTQYTAMAGSPYIRIIAKSVEGREAFLYALNAELTSEERREPSLYHADEWGNINRVKYVPARSLDTVILKPGQIEAIITDLRRFLAEEAEYSNLGVPYHYGVLLHGIPGTGKTSIATAVAYALELDIFHASLTTIKTEGQLKKMLSSVTPRSVLVLEEVDVCAAANANGHAESGLQRDVLLQALDGLTTPHGLITIMTTNHVDRLDPAFVRPGRVDLKMEISAVDTAQVERLCERFIGYVPDELPQIRVEDAIAPAHIIAVFKHYLRDKQAAGPALVKRLNDLLLENIDIEDVSINV